jgi:signal transduction histidine kinase
MKSIRHTLIVYFLVLVTGALAAVSWSSYRTTAHALRERQNDSRKLIETQCDVRSQEVRAALDRRISQQAVSMAETRLSSLNYEPIHAAGLLGVALTTQGWHSAAGAFAWGPPKLPDAAKEKSTPEPMPPMPPAKEGLLGPPYIPIWFFHVPKNSPSFNFARAYPRNTNIEFAEALVVNGDQARPQEYFQTSVQMNSNSAPVIQRSASMGDAWFTLEKDFKDHEKTEDVELRPGLKVRRVTLKTLMSLQGGPPRFGPKGAPNPKGPGQGTFARTVIIQYAADLAPIERQIRQFQKERDDQIANLSDTIEHDLAQLRNRMFWISLASLAAILLGGYGVIRLGLTPLAKMTEAVRKISPNNFHLALDPDKLPQELQPIATRIEESLQELRKAFAREKQAAADISHELRTPLAALMTTLEVGLKKNRSIAEYIEILDECRLSGQHMYQLVERLLTLARLDAGADQYRPADVDVTEMALNCADLIRPLARARGLNLRLHLPDPIIMRTDGNKVREVLVNLLHNAVEYNRPHGSIELSVERTGSDVRLEVRDTGIGIKPDVMSHIFERFYRADSSRHADTPHAGLGLAIVKSYVDLMGGTIRVESSDAGTAFIVELPFVETSITTAVQAAPVLAQR